LGFWRAVRVEIVSLRGVEESSHLAGVATVKHELTCVGDPARGVWWVAEEAFARGGSRWRPWPNRPSWRGRAKVEVLGGGERDETIPFAAKVVVAHDEQHDGDEVALEFADGGGNAADRQLALKDGANWEAVRVLDEV
jgi:hypothetical protein